MGPTKNFGGGLTPAPQPQASFEDLRLGQDLYEGSAQLDGGLPAADDDQQADGQTAVEFCSRLFKELPPPLLPTLESPPPRATLPRTRKPRKKKTLQATRSSLHLAAKPSAVPVAQRAQHKMMGELEFVNPQQPAPDAAVTGYIDLYGADLPEQAIKAIRAATRLVNKELAKALAAMVDEYDAAEMEAQ